MRERLTDLRLVVGFLDNIGIHDRHVDQPEHLRLVVLAEALRALQPQLIVDVYAPHQLVQVLDHPG